MTETIQKTAPIFAPPEPLKLTGDEMKEIAQTVNQLYRKQIQQRKRWEKKHLLYDAMFRLSYEDQRQGPWPGASDLHVPMPYWVADSVNTRLVSSIWGQLPLVSGKAEEDDDAETFRDAAALIEYLMQPKMSNARAMWSLISKSRTIHGVGVGLMSYVTNSKYSYRELQRQGDPILQMSNGFPELDQSGNPQITFDSKTRLREANRYQGPIVHPLGWDDVITPSEWLNLQPRRPDNPGGADWVGVRQWESLSYLWKRRESAYNYIDKHSEAKNKDWWVSQAPSQDRSTAGQSGENQQRVKQHDRYEGRNRNLQRRSATEKYANPEYEILTWFMPWEINGVERECVFFVCLQPLMLLGAFPLCDINWREDRPLLEMHYQRVDNRGYSMGVMEIVQHLSAELDTIHNMRIDVGFATNMPFFFYRAASAFRPEQIVLKPLKGVPVDDINDVRFPQLQSVTSFYHEEEQLLYTLVERVLGVTDLFLGISPTRGAAARHATGFVGTQQEALARTSEVLTQDAESFAFLCRTFYNLEMQFGPQERMVRLYSKDTRIDPRKMTRDQLWMQGEYDFRLGANAGMFSSHVQQQQGMAILQLAASSPFINSDLGRRWEVENQYLFAIGVPDPSLFIGPKDSISQVSPKPQDEENGEMVQMTYGPGTPAPVHPSDNDQQHMRKLLEFTSSDEYAALNYPNQAGFMAHAMLHQRQMQQKAMMQQQRALMASQGMMQPNGQPGQPQQQGPALGQERIEPQLKGVGNMGAMGDVRQSPTAGNRQVPSFPSPVMG